jgi:hypothetical protein
MLSKKLEKILLSKRLFLHFCRNKKTGFAYNFFYKIESKNIIKIYLILTWTVPPFSISDVFQAFQCLEMPSRYSTKYFGVFQNTTVQLEFSYKYVIM